MKITTQDIAWGLFAAMWIPIILYIGAERELKECQKWKQKAFNELSPYKQKKLLEEAEYEMDLLEDIASQPDPR